MLLLSACGVTAAPTPPPIETASVSTTPEAASVTPTPQPDAEPPGLSPFATVVFKELKVTRDRWEDNDENMIRETLEYYFLLRNDVEYEPGYAVPVSYTHLYLSLRAQIFQQSQHFVAVCGRKPRAEQRPVGLAQRTHIYLGCSHRFVSAHGEHCDAAVIFLEHKLRVVHSQRPVDHALLIRRAYPAGYAAYCRRSAEPVSYTHLDVYKRQPQGMTKWRVHFYQIVKTHSLVVLHIKFVSQYQYNTGLLLIQGSPSNYLFAQNSIEATRK